MTRRRKPHGSRFGVLAVLMLAIGALVLAACGGDDSTTSDSADSTSGGEMQDATLVLDFVPGPVHAGIYDAVVNGYYEDEGINLEIIEPTSTADTLKLIDAGKANFGIADGIDVATQIADGRGAKGIMALVQRPLGGLITLTESGFDSPADLDGKTVGVTGVPSDDAIMNTTISDAGGDPASVNKVTIGFNGVQNLESGKVDAFTGFIPADGVQIDVDGFPTTSFALDEYGGPKYPGLVVFSTEDAISSESDLMQGFVSATIRGYEDVIADPQAGLDALLEENPAIPEKFAEASLDAYMPLFEAGTDQYGSFNTDDLESLSTFMVDNDLATEPIAPDRYATNEFVEGSE
ncbi:MAG: ABC transporter substrate-binding protein [Thermoleophilia bacterium]|nr:ABC transporter substrate-binding protein [Thermoleophilia bacterium]GIK77279.1 MAG: nitrate ABC transporter substrate-binding protein [Actinomycetes bacterium]